MSKCAECQQVHPEDIIIAKRDLDWPFIGEISNKIEWSLSCKLANALVDMGNELEHQFHRAECFNKELERLKT